MTPTQLDEDYKAEISHNCLFGIHISRVAELGKTFLFMFGAV